MTSSSIVVSATLKLSELMEILKLKNAHNNCHINNQIITSQTLFSGACANDPFIDPYLPSNLTFFSGYAPTGLPSLMYLSTILASSFCGADPLISEYLLS